MATRLSNALAIMKKNSYLLVFSIIFFGNISAFAANAAQAKPLIVKSSGFNTISATWSAGNKISVCTETTGAPRSCDLVALPEQLESPEKIISGNLVANAKASWIMIGAKKMAVCALLLDSKSVLCHRFTSKKLARVDLSNPENSRGLVSINFTAKSGVDLQRNNVAKIALGLTKRIYSAQQSLTSQIASKPTGHRVSLEEFDDGGGDSGGGGGGGGDDGTGGDDGGGDDGGGGGSPGGDGGSSGGGFGPDDGSAGDPNPYDYAANGATTTCIPGPLIVCITRKPTPFDRNDPISVGPNIQMTWCNVFGILCSDSTGKVTTYPAMGNTQEEQEADCYARFERDLDECQAYRRAFDYRSYNSCKSRSADLYSECLTAVRDNFRQN